MIRVGIDFDNTIVNYENVFYDVAIKKKFLSKSEKLNTKEEVKNHFISLGKEDLWTELQGLVYGKYIDLAKIQPFLFDILEYFNESGLSLFIISHRTKYPYIGEKINLHDSAKSWIFRNLKNLIPKDNIYFEETIDEKVIRANDLNVNFFIDDLEKVLLHDFFSNKVKKILFDPYKNYVKGSNFHIAHSWLDIKDIVNNER